ncbi:MAG: TraR/DksA family transcriptional regulator [Burkholderiales bacterium]|nr:TraR/DksA family transcriptional regulator [Burkholderiales bacterium]
MSQFALTTKQIDDLTALLRQREATLRLLVKRELHADSASHASLTGGSDADWATADADADDQIARAERDVRELNATVAALTKISDGRYGLCDECGEAIGYPRLLAYPGASRCLTCQQKHESRTGNSDHH